MTRWARVGNTQRHHKRPGDATSWEELTRDAEGNSSQKDDNVNQFQKGQIKKKKRSLKMKDPESFTQFKIQSSIINKVKNLEIFEASKLFKNKESPDTAEGNEFQNDQQKDKSPKVINNAKTEKSDSACLPSNNKNITSPQVLTKNQRKKARRKMRLQEGGVMVSQSKPENEVTENADMDKSIENQIASSDKVVVKKRKYKHEEFTNEDAVGDGSSGNTDVLLVDEREGNKKLKKSMDMHVEGQNDNSENLDNKVPQNDGATEVKRMTKNQWKKARRKKKLEQLKAMQASQSQEINLGKSAVEQSETALEKDFLGKKKLLLEKLEQKKGTTLLPSKVQRKIFHIKRRLEEKGVSPNVIREIVQKEKKHEVEKFKKTFSTKPCYNCREYGHLLSDCPLKIGDAVQETGICFKCGSTEHTSYKCNKKVQGYPLAKCFVCKEQGHISKDCPKNKHGVYIKGGKCSKCGNVNHLSKDCPPRKKKVDTAFTADTIKVGISVDAEIPEVFPTISKKNFNKPKVVKF